MDANEIMESINICATEALQKSGILASEIKAVGVTNQRETTVIWDKNSGDPLAPAMLWFDDRTKSLCHRITNELGGDPQVLQQKSGLRINPYFSAFKLRWLIENNENIKKAVDAKAAAFGTVESYVIWKLTGGHHHVTDCTNASRTMLMDLNSLEWCEELCNTLGIPMDKGLLPEKIVSNAEPEAFGTIQTGVLKGVKICGAIGDQQSALVGQHCFEKGQLKNTFGTGQFLLLNTGDDLVISDKGLLSTVAYRMGTEVAPTYAVEGSVAISGVGIKWMIEQMGFGESPTDIIDLASSVESTKGLYFVPAFNGLMAPHWTESARGIMIGWTHYHGRSHLSRALVEALCFQCRDVIEAMGLKPELIKVDGGVCQSDFAMQLLANLTEIPVERPANVETTALGAAIAAAIGCGHVARIEELEKKESVDEGTRFQPSASIDAAGKYSKWGEAVKRCEGWDLSHADD